MNTFTRIKPSMMAYMMSPWVVNRLRPGFRPKDDGVITKAEYKRMARPVLVSSIIGVLVGIIPGTGASEASWFSYNTAKNMSTPTSK